MFQLKLHISDTSAPHCLIHSSTPPYSNADPELSDMTQTVFNCRGLLSTDQSWLHSCHLSTSQHPGSHPQRLPNPSSLPAHRATSSATILDSHHIFHSCGRAPRERISASAPPTRVHSTAKSINTQPFAPSIPKTSSEIQWHPLTEPIWAGSEADALVAGSRVHQLAPPWKVWCHGAILSQDINVRHELPRSTGHKAKFLH